MVIPLMLATLTDRREFADDWLLERKLDGERCVTRKVGAEVQLESRSGKDLTSTYPEVRTAVAGQRSRDLLLDGEIVAYDGEQTSFTRLQQRLGVTRPSAELVAEYPVVYCIFDLLQVDGEDLTDLPLVERRSRLTRMIRSSAALQHTEAWRGDSEQRFADGLPVRLGGAHRQACRRPLRRWTLEGLVEAEVRLGAGVRHRRLHRSRRQPNRLWCPTRRLLRRRLPPVCREGRHRLHKWQRSTTSVSGYASWGWPSRHSSTRSRSHAARTGPGPSSSPRLLLPNGRATLGCGSRAFSGSATTRTPLRS